MQSRKLILFATVTILALGAAITATHLRAPAPQAEKALLFPDLRARANDAAEISVQGHDRSITLAREGDAWVIREADGYPALLERVRNTVIGVAELRKVADKTSNKKMFKRLGVEDVKESGSNSVLLQIRDVRGAELASLIVGRERRSSSRSEPAAMYVRLPGAANAVLVEGRVEASTDPGKWFNRDLFDITPNRVRSVEIAHGDGSRVRLARAIPGGDLTLDGVPAGKEAQSSVVLSRMGTVLESFFIEGARAATKVSLPADAPVMTVRTFDGVIATLTSARVDDKPMAKIGFAFEQPPANDPPQTDTETAPEEAGTPAATGDAATGPKPDEDKPAPRDFRAEAEQLNTQVQDWVFQVPQFKFELLTRRMTDLVRDPLPRGESPINLPD